MKGLFLFSIVLSIFASASAQTFPRWPQSTNIKVFMIRDAFNEKEQIRIDAAAQSWRPFLPEGVTIHIAGETSSIETCRDCVTINRERIEKDEWGECEAHAFDGITWYAVIRVDKRAGSGDAFQRVVTHEIGHSLGLDHRPKSIMSAHAHGAPSEQDGAILRSIYADQTSNPGYGKRR
jgi:Matrixin